MSTPFIAERTDTIRADTRTTAELATPKAASVPATPGSRPSRARPADRRLAVLVGLNDYPGEDEDLPSGLLDVAAMRQVLVERFRYRPENILVLTDRRASRRQIQRAFRNHLL